MNSRDTLNAIYDAITAVQYLGQDYTPERQPQTWHHIQEAMKRLCDAFEDIEAADDAASGEPGPLPDPDYLRDIQEECRADMQSGRGED